MSSLVKSLKKGVKGLTSAIGSVVKSALGIEDPQAMQALDTPPAVTPPPPMPVPDSAAMQREQKQSLARQRRRSGRRSTILTATDEALGG